MALLAIFVGLLISFLADPHFGFIWGDSMAIVLGPGPARGVPLEEVTQTISLKDFVRQLGFRGQAAISQKSVFAESSATAYSGSAVYNTVQNGLRNANNPSLEPRRLARRPKRFD